MDELRDKVVVVTGAARGFGAAFARAVAQAGADVVLVDIDGEEASAVARHITSGGGKAHALIGDVTDEAAMTDVMMTAASPRGGIDILINNAGLHSVLANRPMAELGVAGIRRLFDVNVMGIVNCTLACRPFLTEGSGAIVNIASVAGYSARTAYGASKAAVRALTVAFAHEFGPAGIRVNAIAPGLILTDTVERELSAETKADVMGRQILKCHGSTTDIVEAMLYLCSERSRFVTGETLRVSGGYTTSV